MVTSKGFFGGVGSWGCCSALSQTSVRDACKKRLIADSKQKRQCVFSTGLCDFFFRPSSLDLTSHKQIAGEMSGLD